MTSHSKTYRQISVRTTENRSVAVCHAFKINKNVIRMAGVIRSENIQPFEQLQRSVRNTLSSADSVLWYLSVRTAAVLNSEFGKIQPFKQKSFSVRQRESDQNALDLPNCHTFVTEDLSLLVYCSTGAKILVLSFTFTAHNFSCVIVSGREMLVQLYVHVAVLKV